MRVGCLKQPDSPNSGSTSAQKDRKDRPDFEEIARNENASYDSSAPSHRARLIAAWVDRAMRAAKPERSGVAIAFETHSILEALGA